jgi:hypothetical protein
MEKAEVGAMNNNVAGFERRRELNEERLDDNENRCWWYNWLAGVVERYSLA